MIFFDILAEQATESIEFANCFYMSWGCFGVLVSFFLGSIAFLVNIIPNVKKSKKNFEGVRLALKENTASIFMEAVTLEAQLLIEVIAEHLPISISQKQGREPTLSKFDKFCNMILEIKKEPEEDRRKSVCNFMENEFASLLVEESKKLLKIIKMHTRLGSTDYNATGISYALKPDTALKFSFIAEHLFKTQKHEKKYFYFQKISGYCFVISIISFASFLVPLILKSNICYLWGIISIIGIIVFFIIGFLLWWATYQIIEKMKCLSQEDFNTYYEEWKKGK